MADLFEIVLAKPANIFIPSNISAKELINQVEMDPLATDREKFILKLLDEAVDEAASSQTRADKLESDIENVKDENIGYERDVDKLTAKVAELEARIAAGITALQPAEVKA